MNISNFVKVYNPTIPNNDNSIAYVSNRKETSFKTIGFDKVILEELEIMKKEIK